MDHTSVDEARHAIEETRGRISATLDAIEDRIQVKKEELKEKVDVLRPVKDKIRSDPWPSLGIALGAGLVLGFATGGHDSDSKSDKHTLDDEERDELRKWREQRKKRMRRLARRADASMHTKSKRKERSDSDGKSLRDTLVSALSTAVTDGLKERARRMTEGAS